MSLNLKLCNYDHFNILLFGFLSSLFSMHVTASMYFLIAKMHAISRKICVMLVSYGGQFLARLIDLFDLISVPKDIGSHIKLGRIL